MKKFFVFLIANVIAVTSFCQLTVYARTNNSKVVPNVNFFGTKKISKKMNLTTFLLVEQNWSEALVGLSYSPKDWMSIGLSVGIEHNPALYRFAGSLWLGKGKVSSLTLWEKGDGKENYWYKEILAYKFSDKFTLAAVAWRFHGVGPMANFTPKKSIVTLWAMPAYDFEAKQARAILGISFKL